MGLSQRDKARRGACTGEAAQATCAATPRMARQAVTSVCPRAALKSQAR